MPLWPWTINAVLRERLARLEGEYTRLAADHAALSRKHDRLVDQCLGHVGITHEPIRDLPKAATDPLSAGLAAVYRNLGRLTTPLPHPEYGRPPMTP